MLIKINNKAVKFHGNTVHDLIMEKGLSEKGSLAIAVNDIVIPKTEWYGHKIKENDIIIIIKPAQGG